MSQWRRRDSRDDDASRGRSSRSSAMATDLISGEPEEQPPSGVPQWLVDEQRAHQRNAAPPEHTPPPKKPPPKKHSANEPPATGLISGGRGRPAQASQGSEPLGKVAADDDLILLDMLDGAHLPTRPDSAGQRPGPKSPLLGAPPPQLTKYSDSILSLPPIGADAEEDWKTQRAEAQQRRRLLKGGHSMGGYMPPPHMKVARGGRPSSGASGVPARDAPSASSRPGHKRDASSGPSNLPPPGGGSLSFVMPSTLMPASESTGHIGKDMSVENFREGKWSEAGERNRGRKQGQNLTQGQRERGQESLPRVRSKRDVKRTEAQSGGRAELSKDADTAPLLSTDGARVASSVPGKAKRTRGGSFSVKRETRAEDDEISTGHSSGAGRSGRSKRTPSGKRSRRNRKRRGDDDNFQPSAWGWRMPAEEDAVMPSGAWVYLPLIGWLTFMIAFAVNSLSDALSQYGIDALSSAMAAYFGGKSVLWFTAGLRGLSLATSFLLVVYLSPKYTAGSGIPEMKCVLSGVMMPRMLNWRTLVAKMVGLVFSLASGISIGRLGPFIHMSGITAALVSKIPWFSSLRASARFQLQALSAAMAAGVGATFGAPIGGTMLSIEVMSTYYYIHWLPMALYCSIMGYYFVVSVVESDSQAYFHSSVDVELQLESSERLVTYAVLGALCGVVGAGLVHFTKRAFVFRKRFFTVDTPVRTTVMVVLFAMFHTFVVFSTGGVLQKKQRQGVESLFNAGVHPALWLGSHWKPFAYASWNTSSALFITMLIKFCLTGLSLVMPVPAGTFMPIFETGALLGRAFGELCNSFAFVDWVDPRATAIIGAAALTSGTLHTTSIAVVMLELTREAIDVMPLAVGVIVSYGVSKQLCSDLFSELIKIRRLPFILGLRERYPSENRRFFEDVASVVAGSFMDTDFPFVTPESTKGEVYTMLTAGGKPWINCAFLSDPESRRLWGTVTQRSLWDSIGEDFVSSPSLSDEELGYGAIGVETRRERHEDEYIPFLQNFDPAIGSPFVDMGPMQVSYHTPFWKIITLFRMLSMSIMYVMKDGETVGCVSKAQVISHSIEVETRANRERHEEREAETKRKRDHKELVRQLRKEPPAANRLASRMSDADLASLGGPSGRRSRQGSFSISRR